MKFRVLIAITAVAIYAWFQLPQPKVIQLDNVMFSTIDGRRIELSSLAGRPVLLNFWATSCPPCVEETPDLVALHNQQTDTGLQIIGIAMPHDMPSQVLAFVAEQKISYPISLDVDGKISRTFNVQAIPNNILISPDNKIIMNQVGKLDINRVSELVNNIDNKQS
jgi:peroxiredoxin